MVSFGQKARDMSKDIPDEVSIEQTLINLHRYNIWSEELLGELFQGVMNKLHPRERLILELKVEGKTDNYILNILKRNTMQGSFTLVNYQRMIRRIKHKLRITFNSEIQGWIKDISKKENENEEIDAISDSVDDDYTNERTSEES